MPTAPINATAAPTIPSAAPLSTPTDAPSTRPTHAPPDPVLERSNEFWTAMTPLDETYEVEYRTLVEMVAASDLIIVGLVVDTYRKSVVDQDNVDNEVWATVAIDDVIKGIPNSREDGFVEMRLGDASSWDRVKDNIPDHRSLFFLINAAAWLERAGEPADRAARRSYWRENAQTILRDIGGVTRVLPARHRRPAAFPMTLEGLLFDQVIGQVRPLVER